MKSIFSACLLLTALMTSAHAQTPGSMLRVGCEGNDIGAEVSINGKFKGECPLDIQVGEGDLQMRLVKKVDTLHERVFEQDIRMGDGVVKRVEARLGPAQLTAEGRRVEAQRQETARLREEARLRDIAAAEQKRQEAVARGLAELRAQGVEPGNGKAFRDCADCPEMVWIPPGKLPQRVAGDNAIIGWLNQVSITYPLAIGRFEITFDEWALCVNDGACDKGLDGKGPAEGFTYGTFVNTHWGRGRQPVINVSKADVERYLAWISKKTGQQYRLLSLAEFTYAARGGRSTKLPWGDDIGRNNANCANCGSSTGGAQPADVGSFKANDWGLHDMVGNVADMVADCVTELRNLLNAPKDGGPIITNCSITTPPEMRTLLGDTFVAMGGAWNSNISTGIGLESFYEKYPGSSTGLRIARTLPTGITDTSKVK
jgi:formylglycine-generating enzyme required for sulfatase activity